MNKKARFVIVGIFVVLPFIGSGVAPGVGAVPSKYIIIDLGTLGGSQSAALGMNDLGQVVGGADTADGGRHAFLWDNDHMIDLGLLPGVPYSEGWDINNNGQVIGFAAVVPGKFGKGFFWEDGEMIELGTLGGSTTAHAINDSGQVVGSSAVSGFETHAYLWENGVMTDIPSTLGSPGSLAWDINNSGQIVGLAGTQIATHAFLWEDDNMIDLGTLGGDDSVAVSINDLEQVVGYAHREGKDTLFHAFLWQNSQMIDIGAILGLSSSLPEDINNAGVVLVSGYLYDSVNNVAHLIEDLLPADHGWQLIRPRALNNEGWIAGVGTFQDRRRAFLMKPPPPIPTISNGGAAVMIVVLLSVAMVMIHKRLRMTKRQP